MFARVKQWIYHRMMRRLMAAQARAILQSPDASAAAIVAARIIADAIQERRPLCSFCFNRFEPQPREQAEWFRLRAILMIPDIAPDPMICESCFQAAAATFNQQATNVGTSNMGQANLVLRHLH